jgi:hypothetical protein
MRVLAVLLLLLPVPGLAAGFDCKPARTPTETALCADAAQAVRVPVPAASLGVACVPIRKEEGETCRVSDSGRIGNTLAWQVQDYQADDGPRSQGVVVMAVRADGSLLPLVWDAQDDAFYGAPVLIRRPGAVLLDLRGNLSGTGNISAESLYQADGDAWREIDIVSWLAALDARLPADRRPWKGIYPDWKSMTADTYLWHRRDGNCCPTGGRAHATLALRDGKIVLTGVRLSGGP